MRAAVFPGQGSQAVGMGMALAEAYPAAAAVFAEVDEALNEKLSAIIRDGPLETLTLTRNAQPALMATSLATMRALEAEGASLGRFALFAAGHSLGEYSALAAAGAVCVSDAARLLRLRGQSMQAAVPVGEGAMAVVLGLALSDAEALAEQASQAAGGAVCEAANDNARGQVVLSGAKAAIDQAVALAKGKGAKRAALLPVSAPFHCALMAPAADKMEAALAQIHLNSPTVPIVANVKAEATSDAAEIKDLLVRQVTGRVRWRESGIWMAEHGVTEFVEIGAGKVLSGLAKRIDDRLRGLSLQTPEDIRSFAQSL